MKTGTKGIELIKKFEGFRSKAYLDSVGVPTIGYGTTLNVHLGQVITESQATDFLKRDISLAENTINSSVKVPLTQDQFDALVCFTYNLGSGNFKSSTLLKLLNQKKYDLAAGEFIKWNKAGGKVLAGLTTRRQAEALLFSTGKVN